MRFNLDRLISKSSLIIEGTVVRVTNEEGNEQIVATTTYKLCQIALVVGDYNNSCLDIRLPGGRRGDVYSGYSGMPRLELNERYILFLTKQNNWHSPFTGWWQGVYRVVDVGGDAVILSDDGQPIIDVDSNGFVQVAGNEEQSYNQSERDENEGHYMTFAVKPMKKTEFLFRLNAQVQHRARLNQENPSQLPTTWKCRDSVNIPVSSPPRAVEEVDQ